MTKNKNGWLNYAGEICTSKKDPNEKYIKVIKDLSLNAGGSMTMVPYKDHCAGLLKAGFINQEEYEKKLSRNWVLYVLNVPPQDDEESQEIETTESGWINDAIEIRTAGKKGFFVKVMKPFSVEKGAFISLKKVQDSIKFQFEQGRIDEQTKERLLKSLMMKDENGNVIENKFWLHYKGSIPPAK